MTWVVLPDFHLQIRSAGALGWVMGALVYPNVSETALGAHVQAPDSHPQLLDWMFSM